MVYRAYSSVTEQRTHNPSVVGLNPTAPTIKNVSLAEWLGNGLQNRL